MSKKIMLFTLDTFKSTGGIQNMTRTMAYSLEGISKVNGWQFQLWSLYDAESDLKAAYLQPNNFQAFEGSKLAFFKRLLNKVIWPDIVIISHVNLAIVGLIIKLFNSKCKVWLIAHGIEVWQNLSPIKRALLNRCERIVCVSTFTKQQMIALHNVPESKCVVLNNALDPFFQWPQNFEKPEYLLKRYELSKTSLILFTLARIHRSEQYKGYDKVIEAMAVLKDEFPDLKYILGGKSDVEEKKRLETLITKYHLEHNVILSGFIDENEIIDHFLLASLFVMPSNGEGFGLVLIEAAACGLSIICGNSDGSIDAMRHGELGDAIDVTDISALSKSIKNKLQSPLNPSQKKELQHKCLDYFNIEVYQKQLNNLISNDR